MDRVTQLTLVTSELQETRRGQSNAAYSRDLETGEIMTHGQSNTANSRDHETANIKTHGQYKTANTH